MIEFIDVSKWYGDIMALNNVSFTVEDGKITGLLGPNGAGKSTSLKLIVGLLKPSKGTVKLNGKRIWGNKKIYRQIGFLPENNTLYDELTGYEFVRYIARMRGVVSSHKATLKAMEMVGLTNVMNRKIGGYSLGMRQRLKFAQTIVHKPDFLILDEPLNGMDPIQRNVTINLMKEMSNAGKTILISSHILAEVQKITSDVVVINKGKIAATGSVKEIRRLIRNVPYHVYISCKDDKRELLAARLIEAKAIQGVEFLKEPSSMIVQSSSDEFFRTLPRISVESRVNVQELKILDENMQSVFDYLIGDRQ